MSTRACYRFFPLNGPNDWPGVVTVYKHSDGYPSGAAKAIAAALPCAWPLPRFEPDEFAAAFVRANKKSFEDWARGYETDAEKETDPEQKAFLLERAQKYRTDPVYRDCCGGGVQISEFPTGDFGSNRQAVSGETDRPFRSKGARRCGVVSVPALANRRCGVDSILLWSVQASTLVSIIAFGDCWGAR